MDLGTCTKTSVGLLIFGRAYSTVTDFAKLRGRSTL